VVKGKRSGARSSLAGALLLRLLLPVQRRTLLLRLCNDKAHI
jgi:hypothetical protein